MQFSMEISFILILIFVFRNWEKQIETIMFTYFPTRGVLVFVSVSYIFDCPRAQWQQFISKLYYIRSWFKVFNFVSCQIKKKNMLLTFDEETLNPKVLNCTNNGIDPLCTHFNGLKKLPYTFASISNQFLRLRRFEEIFMYYIML